MNHSNRHVILVSTLTAMSLLSGPGFAVDRPASTSPNRLGVESTVSDSSANTVLIKLHRNNAMEIEMGKLAQSKSPDESVRDYGKMLVADHEAAQKKVTDLASDRNLAFSELNQTASGKRVDTLASDSMNRLNSLKGVEFDRAFLKHMIEGHAHTAKMLRASESNLTDAPEVRALVKELIPVIEKHLSKANDLLKQVGKTGLSGQPG